MTVKVQTVVLKGAGAREQRARGSQDQKQLREKGQIIGKNHAMSRRNRYINLKKNHNKNAQQALLPSMLACSEHLQVVAFICKSGVKTF